MPQAIVFGGVVVETAEPADNPSAGTGPQPAAPRHSHALALSLLAAHWGTDVQPPVKTTSAAKSDATRSQVDGHR